MWPFDGLFTNIQSSFSKASSDYNEVHKLSKKIDTENALIQQQNPLRTMLTRVFTNRYNGATHVTTMWGGVLEGALWTYYFAFSPQLKKDVGEAGMAWAKSKLQLPNFSIDNVKRGLATGLGTSRADLGRLEHGVNQRGRHELQMLAGSLMFSAMVTHLFKRTTNLVHHHHGKMLMRGGLVTWRATGVLALFYGLHRVYETMHEHGEFSTHLKVQRDQYVGTQRAAFQRTVEHLAENSPEIGWLMD